MTPTHYSVLGVSATAPPADIKRAYRRLAVQFHPDKHGGSPRFEEQFKAVALAYGVLSDPDRRAHYDFQLAQAARRAADEQRRTAAPGRPLRPNAYGMAGPPPAGPLRTRPPAGARERHYAPRQRVRFTPRDWLLTVALVAGLVLFGVAVKATMDRVTATADYADGLRAYTRHQWATAYSYFESALHFRPDHAGALQRRAELDELIDHDPAAAAAGYAAALAQPQPPRRAAGLRYRLGRCQAALADTLRAEASHTAALRLDPALAAAWLARGSLRLFGGRPAAALADLRHGLRLLARQGRPAPWPAHQIEGLALARLGRYAEARAAYELARATRPTDGSTYFLLGRLAQREGNAAGACAYFRQAVALGYGYAGSAAAACR